VALKAGTTELEGEASLEVSSSGEVSANASQEAVTVTVQRGRVALHVRHREPGDRSFSVKAGGFSFQVLGTVFEVERSTGATVDLAVKQGLVAVVQDGRVLAKVGAGGSWHGQAREEAATSEAVPQGGALAEARSAERLDAMTQVTPRHRPALARVSLLGSVPTGRARARRAATLPDGSGSASNDKASAARAATEGLPRSGEPEEAPAPASPPGHLSRRASCLALETSGRAPEAISCYETLGLGDGLAAEASLYQAAVLRRDAVGDPEGALDSFRAYQKRFPDGSLADEVGISVAELLPRLGRYQEALQETDSLFARGAGNERRSELLMLRGRILLDGLKDPGRAEGTFAEVAAGSGDIAVEALYFRGLCLQKLGRTVEARETFASYLARGRVPAHLRDVRARLGLGQL
jgi:tetratricopeptide (TPR) repeat protein